MVYLAHQLQAITEGTQGRNYRDHGGTQLAGLLGYLSMVRAHLPKDGTTPNGLGLPI